MNDTNNRTHAHHFDNLVKKTPEGDVEVFEYTGKKCLEEGFRRIPKDVVSVRFHPSVVTVEDHDGMGFGRGITFLGCHSLNKVVFNEGLQKIGRDAFYECVSLDSINNIPSSVTSIVDGAFYQCISLKKIVLNEGLVEIGWKAFGQCNALKSITIPSTVVEIGQVAFMDCSNLREILLNEGLQIIGVSTFSSCISLDSISIPSTVTKIGARAFSNCTRLRQVSINGKTKKISFDAFIGCPLERITFPSFSTRLKNIIQVGYSEVMSKIDPILGPVEWRNDELFINPDSIQVPGGFRGDVEYGHNWKRSLECIAKIDQLITHHEVKEATTLFELALWKAKIDQAWESDDVIVKDRYAYRIEVPGPVKEKIVQFLCVKSDSSEEEMKDIYKFYLNTNIQGGFHERGRFDTYL